MQISTGLIIRNQTKGWMTKRTVGVLVTVLNGRPKVLLRMLELNVYVKDIFNIGGQIYDSCMHLVILPYTF
jgi:hypothetical protein